MKPYVNYLKDSLEDIADDLITRLQYGIEIVEQEQKLCCEEGVLIVAEFGFKGDVKQVLNQAKKYLNYLEKNGVTETQRLGINKAHQYAIDCLCERELETSFREEFKEAALKGSYTLMESVVDRKGDYFKRIHDNKECLCYINN